MCLPPHCELQYPVRSLDEDEGLLSAAVEGGSVNVDEFISDLQLLAVGSLPCILDLNTRQDSLEMQNRRSFRQEKSLSRTPRACLFCNPFQEDVVVELSMSLWQLCPERHLQNILNNIPETASHSSEINGTRACVCAFQLLLPCKGHFPKIY